MGFNAATSRSASKRNAIAEQIDAVEVEHLEGERKKAPTHEGGAGFAYDSCEALYQLVVSSFLSGDTFYEGNAERTTRLRHLVDEVAVEKPEFIPALAAYARNELNMRTTPTVLVAEALQRGIVGADRAARLVWLRGDEHLEALGYLAATKQKRTKRMMRAVQERLNRLTQRQALRYASTGAGKAFSQKGALVLAHPTPADARQSALFAYMVKGWPELPEEQKALLPVIAANKAGEQDASWEQTLSREGSSKETWEKAIPGMGYMALLRNLRNFVEKGISMKAAEAVVAKLVDPAEVSHSKQLPFRFLSAWKVLNPEPGYGEKAELPSKVAKLLSSAVEKAMDLAAANVPELPGRTLILVDVSGSMMTPLSAKSTVMYSEAAAVLGAIVAKRTEGGEMWAFGTDAGLVTVGASASLLSVAQSVPHLGDKLGHGTEIEHAMKTALLTKRPGQGIPQFDRLMIFTDMQTWSTGGYYNLGGTEQVLAAYRKVVPSFKAYGVNMAGYSTSAFKKLGNGALTAEVGGWSEKIIDLALQMETGDPVDHIMRLWVDSTPTDTNTQTASDEEEEAG